MNEAASVVDIGRIMEILPHRYPILLVDRVEALIPGQSATGIKNVTINEPFFEGHFPGHPVMPGVLIIEALAQTAAVMAGAGSNETAGKIVYFMTIENARFRRPVRPGDQLKLMVEKDRSRGQVWRFKGRAVVDDKTVAEASFAAMLMDEAPAQSEGEKEDS